MDAGSSGWMIQTFNMNMSTKCMNLSSYHVAITGVSSPIQGSVHVYLLCILLQFTVYVYNSSFTTALLVIPMYLITVTVTTSNHLTPTLLGMPVLLLHYNGSA